MLRTICLQGDEVFRRIWRPCTPPANIPNALRIVNGEKKPTLVSLIKTEAQDPKNCQAAGMAEGATDGFGVGSHYCNVDRLDDPRLLSCAASRSASCGSPRNRASST
jgi:hypothetical protein